MDADVRELKANPGRWALVREGMKSTGAIEPWKKRGCEATARKRPGGGVDVWARWNEGTAPPAPQRPESASEPEPKSDADPENLPDPAALGGYMAARAKRQDQAAARRAGQRIAAPGLEALRAGQGPQVGAWKPGGITSDAPRPTGRTQRGTRNTR